MSILQILETIFISPLKLIFEFIFQIAFRFTSNPGLAIILLSLLMNILVLPLYMRADAMQEESRKTEDKLRRVSTHIKKVFSGDEKMMILQTYYRQNNYKPTSALKGSVSLLLEIPFFMAAYQFLSNLASLNNASLGPISDLGSPDKLIVIGGIAINLLPILMTVINIVSSAIFLKGFPLKTKLQLYGMALFFLVFLYNSPAGLVFYWTLNNTFSLVKTIFYKLKNPKKILSLLSCVIGLLSIAFSFFQAKTVIRLGFVVVGVLLQLPVIIRFFKKKNLFSKKKTTPSPVPNKKAFVLGCAFIAVLTGVLIPSTYISASPLEFVDPSYFQNPLWYILSTSCFAVGTFFVWMRVFYWLSSDKAKVIFERVVWILSGLTLTNYMFFGTDTGIISATLKYEDGFFHTHKQQLINILILLILSAVFCFIAIKLHKIVLPVLLIATIALGSMSTVNIVKTNAEIKEFSAGRSTDTTSFTLSQKGQNIVVIMLDRAIGMYIPYFFNEKPELQEKFSGFTYYRNTISHGPHTVFCVPALFGGYEYTPVEINKRDDESLVSKHNEALKVLPAIFDSNNYEVTVCDPPIANYKWIPDLSIYNDYPDINTYNTEGSFSDTAQNAQNFTNILRNFFCFSLMKTMPLSLQPIIYDGGKYNRATTQNETANTNQIEEGFGIASGYNNTFMRSYNVLVNLPTLTKISEDNTNTFLMFANNATHEPTLLQEPDYSPEVNVNNSEYLEKYNTSVTTENGTLSISDNRQLAHYQTTMAAMIQLGNWLDYLRENNVYDNTRIIFVADHGNNVGGNSELIYDDGTDEYKDLAYYTPLLMVKDFNSTTFTVSDDFMTNADVPTLATKDVISNPTNPFTGNPINSDEKTAHDQYVILFNKDIGDNTFAKTAWASVKDNLWDKENWTFFNQETVLKEHKSPDSP